MKKISLKSILMIIIVLLVSGCTVVNINSMSIDEVIESVLKDKTDLKTVSLEGYSYYLPQGVSLKTSSGLNSVLYYNHKKMYMYVDLVSYFHKVENTYQENENAYYSKKFEYNNKSGYLEITELSKDKYFIEYMFNYSKVEAISNKKDLNKTLTQIGYILNSVKYNELILDSLVGEGSLKYKEEQFDIFKSNGSEIEFIDIIEQNDDGRLESKDEDILELDENLS